MLTKKETLDTIKKTLNLYKTNVLDNIYAKTEYVDSKALPIILINDENKTGPALFPLLPEHNLVFIAGDAQIPDSTGAITTIYGLCYSDLQNDGSKLITEYRTGKAAKVNSNGVLESFEYIDTNVKSIVSNIKGGTINKVLAKNSDTDFDYKWVDMPSIETFKKYVDDTKEDLEKHGVYIEDILDHVPLSEFTTIKEFDKESPFNGYVNLDRLIETDTTKQYDYYMAVQTLEYNNSVGHSRIMKIGRNSTTNKLTLNSIVGDGNSCINTTMGYTIKDFTEYSINDGKFVVNNSESKSTFKLIIGNGFAKDRFANIEGYTTENYMQTKITVRLFKVDPSINTLFPIYSNEYGGLLSYDNSFSENTHNIGIESISMGLENDAGNNALIMGNNNNIGRFSLVSGFKNKSKGYNSLIIGASNNLTAAYNNHALGDYLDISEPYTLAIGKYGTVPASLIFAVCNGTSNTDKKVIFGIERSTGLPIVDAAPTANNHLTNKKYVDDVKASIVVPTKTSELTNDSKFLTEHQSLTGLATETYVNDKVAGIVNSAPETLDTLQELATALGNDANFATTVSTQIGKKVDKADGMSLTHNDLTNELKANYDAAYTYSQAKHSYNDLTDKPTIPSIDGLATEEYVQNAIASAGIGTGSDVATDDEVKTTINTILGGDYIE